jgi:release factor glutamine methyltransferase
MMLHGPEVVSRLRAAGCVFAEDEARILFDAAVEGADLEAMLAERLDGVPLEHIVGWVEFVGRRIPVDRGVFVPRRRTEALAAAAVRLTDERSVVVELCAGAAAVAVTVRAAVPSAEVHAADIDPLAVANARRNLGENVHEGDLFDALPEGLRARVDVLVANAPYVPTDAIALMPPEARDHEDRIALDGGSDGLDVHRRIAAGAGSWLAPGAHVLVETSESQAPLDAAIFARAGFEVVLTSEDDTTIVDATAPNG